MTSMNDHTTNEPETGQARSDNAHSSADTEQNDPADLAVWTLRIREGMGRMANDEAERLKVARRLF